MRVPEVTGALIHVFVDLFQQVRHTHFKLLERENGLSIPSGDVSAGAITEFFSTSLGPTSRRTGTPRNSQSLNLNPGETSLRSSTFTAVLAELAVSFQPWQDRAFFRIVLVNGHHHHLDGCQFGRQDQPLVVAWVMMMAPMKRVERPQEVVQQYCRVLFIQILDIKGFGEVLSQQVRGARLKGLRVTHHRLDGIRFLRAGEFFVG